jgi:hypothetical protein
MPPRKSSRITMVLHSLCERWRCLLSALGAATFLMSCSAAPLAIDSTHPASVDAPEGTSKRIPNLSPDAATQRTKALLAERQRQAEAEESAAPADQSDLTPKTPPSTPSTPNGASPNSNPHHD